MRLLSGLRVVQIGQGLAAAVCGRLLADLAAEVFCIDADASTPLATYLDHGKTTIPGAGATASIPAGVELVVVEGSPAALGAAGLDAESLRRRNPAATIVLISPFGQTGVQASDAACDLTLLAASGIARMLTGQVDDLDEAPLRPISEQSAFIGGIAAACAAMHAVLLPAPGAVIDVSIQEALATLAMAELARAGLTGKSWNRQREADGNGATVTILPARNGYVAISPREERQWSAWLAAMGHPAWGADPRFARKPDRVANWDALHALMSDWSRQHDKQRIAELAQAAHVPSFPLREPAEHLDTPQLEHRRFYRSVEIAGRMVKMPGLPFGLSTGVGTELHDGSGHTEQRRAPDDGAGKLPLAGVRVLDFSWVIAGPTTTRYLAAMGAEIIKIEAPGQGDPGRASELHTVLGQAKRSMVLDLKTPEAIEIARKLAARSDILVENFATGVMERLGLGADALQSLNPDLLYVSASGLGRTGPQAHAVAYGTLLQSYAGFAGLNRHPDRAPRIGMAWLDPMCGLMLAFIVAACLWYRRRRGSVARVDFSMIEAMLWTMAEPLLAAQLGTPATARANCSDCFFPHGIFRCSGEDAWVAIAVTGVAAWRGLCAAVPALAKMRDLDLVGRRREASTIETALAAWALPRAAGAIVDALQGAGVATATVATSLDLLASEHLRQRGFWEPHEGGVLPGLPWHASFGRKTGIAPELGEHTEAILRAVLNLSPEEIAALRRSGALGPAS